MKASQKQRELERKIRKAKREYLAVESVGEDTAQAAAALTKHRQKLKDFLKETGLRQDNFLEQVAGFGRGAVARVRQRVKSYNQYLQVLNYTGDVTREEIESIEK